ncbi:hypothetical protein DAPPUDRAFT_247738 [Daphnia pulex]|uniref:Uncharacterized protein n=1 Tax=Daphnia pulex TaxID=6669 RepID=E9GTA5_DAPPU|nr:hypothetical protein DAPPUDRAFT_247738 [Daphnia pulex]|eukprot:EFX77246.1 hypothetical protein DAPPUDRAFT_247738 [Daphnia pulex]
MGISDFNNIHRTCDINFVPYQKPHWEKTTSLRMVLKDGVCYAKLANDWAKYLYIDAIYNFQLIQPPNTDLKIIVEYNDQLRINFNFDDKKIINICPTINIPDVINIIGQLVSCLDTVGPDAEAGYDNIQQDYVIKDETKQVAMTIKDVTLFRKLKFFPSHKSKEPVINRITRVNPISNNEGEFLFVDEQESNVEFLLQSSTLYKKFMGDDGGIQNSLQEKRNMEETTDKEEIKEEPEIKKQMCE